VHYVTVLEWRTLADRPLDQDVVLTIGVFDGLHVGHRTLLERVIAHGGGAPAVLSFDRLPSSVLFGTSGRLILSRRQKERALELIGVRYLIVVDFSLSFSKLTGEEFVSQLLRRAAVRGIVVGQDFRCGRRRDTDTEKLHRLLRRYGVDMEVVDLVRDRTERVARQECDGAKVSSSGIRQAIDIGDVSVVRSLLGGDYELDVEHVTPQRTGDGLVFPASSLTQLLPRPGRYSGFVRSVSGGPVSGGPVSGGPASGGSTARIAVESDRVIVNAAADPVAGIRFARRES
jgi:riboflavin kinase/FMN adenylyltransferase